MQSISTTPDEALPTAVAWLQDILLGSVASTLAVLAIAVVGLQMLGGRVPVRRGATVVIGCFVLFSAATIAVGILNLVGGQHRIDIAASPPAPTYTPALPRAPSTDPYAGAAVPFQR